MFDDVTLPAQVLQNPSQLQRLMLQELETRMNGTVSIADPNNGFCFLAEAASSTVAQYVRRSEARFEALYPKRATTLPQLYSHMSDFDYLNLTANPAETTLVLRLNRDYLLQEALDLSTEYKMAVLPANTVFMIGAHFFALYYPVQIKINVRSGSFTVMHDVSVPNPLKGLATELIPHELSTYMGVNIITIQLPVAQLQFTTHLETPVSATGFTKSYVYADKFCAVRAWTNINNAWRELSYTLSDDVYDRDVATLKITLISDVTGNRLIASIPQIYFTRGLIGPQLKVVIYTTEGSIDLALTTAELQACSYAFDPTDPVVTNYSTVLQRPPFVSLVPSTATIAGGSDGLTFEELRRRVIQGSLYTQVPITTLDLENYVADAGFVLSRQLDNITRRVNHANRRLVDAIGRTAPVTMASVIFNREKVAETASMRRFDDNVMVALPTTIYRYTATGNLCTPLTDAEVAYLGGLLKSALVAELNSVVYTRTPFHLAVYADDRYPYAKTFDLMTVHEPYIRFVRENVASTAQISVNKASLIHRGNGTGGYELRLAVVKTTDMEAIAESDVYVIVRTADKAGRLVHQRASWLVKDGSYHIYSVVIPTDYHLSADRYLRTVMLLDSGVGLDVDLPLTCEFDVRFFVPKTVLSSVPDDTAISADAPLVVTNMLGLSRQSVTVTFGTDLSGGIYNRTEALWSPLEYVTYPEDVYRVYEQDVPAMTTINGMSALDYSVVDGQVVVQYAHRKGDIVLDEDGNPLLDHAQGSVRYDTFGRPIVLKDRQVIYYVEAIQFDARLYASEDPVDTAFVTGVADTIVGHCQTVTALRPALIERTELYFRPIRTMGTATFTIGNDVTRDYDLGMAFTIKYYVTKAVMADDVRKAAIAHVTESVIEENVSGDVISLTAISAQLRERLGSDIVSIDVLGINADPTLQTVSPTQVDARAMVSRKLILNKDGTVGMVRDIDVKFDVLLG